MFKIHEKLKRIRQFRGFKQTDIAKLLNLSVASYSRIESGKTNLNIDLLKKICKILEIELIDLMENNVHFLAESEPAYGKKNSTKEAENKKQIVSLIEENNLLLKTMLNLLVEQKEINKKLLKLLEKSRN